MPDLPSHRDPDLRPLWGEAEPAQRRGRTDKSATLANEKVASRKSQVKRRTTLDQGATR